MLCSGFMDSADIIITVNVYCIVTLSESLDIVLLNDRINSGTRPLIRHVQRL